MTVTATRPTGLATVQTVGVDRAIIRLNRLRAKLADLSFFWPEVIAAFIEREKRWFDAEGEGTWPALSPTYAAWKAVHIPGAPILVASGDLRESLTTEKTILAQTNRNLILGSQLPYAGYLHTGTSKMPKRDPVIPIQRLAAGIVARMNLSLRFT